MKKERHREEHSTGVVNLSAVVYALSDIRHI